MTAVVVQLPASSVVRRASPRVAGLYRRIDSAHNGQREHFLDKAAAFELIQDALDGADKAEISSDQARERVAYFTDIYLRDR